MAELYKLDFSNGKSYIGMTSKTAKERFRGHKRDLLLNKKDFALYRAWRLHGEPVLTVLAVLEISQVHASEIRAIKVYGTKAPNGYNLTDGGEGTFGFYPTEETRLKLSAAVRNRGPEYRMKLSMARMGHAVSEETRAKIGTAHRGKTISQEHRAKLREAHTGRPSGRKGVPLSEETKAKLRAAMLGVPTGKRRWGWAPTKEHIEAIRKAHLGKIVSEETREKIGASKRGKPSPAKGLKRTPEQRARISASLTGLKYPNREKTTEATKLKQSAYAHNRTLHHAAKISASSALRYAIKQNRQFSFIPRLMTDKDREALEGKIRDVLTRANIIVDDSVSVG